MTIDEQEETDLRFNKLAIENNKASKTRER